MKGKKLYKSAVIFLFAFPIVMKQYLVNQACFRATFNFLNSRFFEPISVSLEGSKNRDSTVYEPA